MDEIHKWNNKSAGFKVTSLIGLPSALSIQGLRPLKGGYVIKVIKGQLKDIPNIHYFWPILEYASRVHSVHFSIPE